MSAPIHLSREQRRKIERIQKKGARHDNPSAHQSTTEFIQECVQNARMAFALFPNLSPQRLLSTALHTRELQLQEAEQMKVVRPDLTAGAACKAGCSACCYQKVPVAIIDILRVCKFILELRADLVPQWFRLISHYANMVRGMNHRERWDARIRCPFLTTDDTCAVYPVRPTACATYLVMDSAGCQHGATVPAKIMFHASKLNMDAWDGVIKEQFNRAGLDTRRIELITGVDYLLRNPSKLQGWLNGERWPDEIVYEETPEDVIPHGKLVPVQNLVRKAPDR